MCIGTHRLTCDTVLHVPVNDIESALHELYDEIGCEYVHEYTYKPKDAAAGSSASSSSAPPRRQPRGQVLIATTFCCSYSRHPRAPKGSFAAIFFSSFDRELTRIGAATAGDKQSKPKRQHSTARQGLDEKPSKKVGCKAKIVVRVLRDKPDQAEIELKGEHNHPMDLTLRRLLPEMRAYVCARECCAIS